MKLTALPRVLATRDNDYNVVYIYMYCITGNTQMNAERIAEGLCHFTKVS